MASSSGRDLEISIDLGDEVEIDSISLNFYLYQDAWIFMPSTVSFIVDGVLEVKSPMMIALRKTIIRL